MKVAELVSIQVDTHKQSHADGPMSICQWNDCVIVDALIEAHNVIEDLEKQ